MLRALALGLVLSASADLPPHWTRITEEKGKRFILDGCDTGVESVGTDAKQMAFDFGQDSETYDVAAIKTVDDGYDVTISRDGNHLVRIRYKDRKKGLAEFSSGWDGFRGAGLYVSDDLKKKFKTVKEKNCGPAD